MERKGECGCTGREADGKNGAIARLLQGRLQGQGKVVA